MMDAAVIPDPDTVARSDRAPDAAGPLPAERLPSLEARHDLPYGFAREHGLVRIDDDRVALREGADPRRLLEARRRLGHGFAVEVVDATTFDRHLSDHYAIDGQAMGLAGEIGGDGLDLVAGDLPTADDLLDSADDAPAIRLVHGIIAEAARRGVSDIHVEPYETGLVVRMREDGVLREELRMPPHVAPVVVSRIKVMARLDIAERRVPQDGRISLTLGGKLIDVRVSTLPNRAGERVVLRVLDKDKAGIDLDALGVTGRPAAVLRDALSEPNGILLVTGPTGSGKTTTLYAGLQKLNDGSRNILTVEDPVEYAVEGVGQTQVNAKVGLTFASGLRAILRQDPDVVMVGEIRDRETAEIAVQASLTGHLVLSTVHTNDSAGAITRLRDMRIEPFLLASTLRAVLAQRLVRRLCPTCRSPHAADVGTAAALALPSGATVWEAVGCDACGQSGFRGRVGLFEAIRVDDTIRRLVGEGADEDAIAAHAFRDGGTLSDEARRAVLDGTTTPAEAIRVARREQADEDATFLPSSAGEGDHSA